MHEYEGVGYSGGLLIVSQIGRPIEFHCTAPVLANRAQQILYGQTYPSFLFCEQIGIALLEKANLKPNVLIVDSEPLMDLENSLSVPVVFFAGQGEDQERSLSTANSIAVGEQTVWIRNDSDQPQDSTRNLASQLLKGFSKSLTLDEPFERIEKAMEEVQLAVHA